MINNAVVTHLKRKDADGYTETPIGPELRYVGGMENSHIHNLEEQLIIGTDKTCTHSSVIDPDTGKLSIVDTTIYKTNTSLENAYYVTSFIEKEPYLNFNASTNKLTINIEPAITNEGAALFFMEHLSENDEEPNDPDEIAYRMSTYTQHPESGPDNYSAESIIYTDDNPPPFNPDPEP